MDKYAGILIALANTAVGGICAYYARATYYSSLPQKSVGQVGISTMSARWPIVAIGVLGILLLISTWVVIYINIATPKAKQVTFPKWPDPYKPISVIGKAFSKEKVILDGYSYDHCTFDNVTLVYNGTTAIQMSNITINGPFNLTSDNPAVGATVALLDALVGLPDDIIIKLPPGNVLEKRKR